MILRNPSVIINSFSVPCGGGPSEEINRTSRRVLEIERRQKVIADCQRLHWKGCTLMVICKHDRQHMNKREGWEMLYIHSSYQRNQQCSLNKFITSLKAIAALQLT